MTQASIVSREPRDSTGSAASKHQIFVFQFRFCVHTFYHHPSSELVRFPLVEMISANLF